MGETLSVVEGELEEKKQVTVRQVPLTDMLSPRWTSVKIGAHEVIVRVVPPVESWVSTEEISIHIKSEAVPRWTEWTRYLQ